MGQLKTYPFTFSDGTAVTLGAWLPPSYVKGNPQKWYIALHGAGSDWHYWLDNPQHQALADKYNLVIVGFMGRNSYNGIDWVDVPETGFPNKNLEEATAFIRKKLELFDYLPCMCGASMGGYKTLYEMVYHAERYSAFAASCPMADSIAWEKSHWNAIGQSMSWIFGGSAPPEQENTQIVANWERHSIATTISKTGWDKTTLKGRKLWAVHAKDDKTISYAAVYQPLINAFPVENVYKTRLLETGGHVDFIRDYPDEVGSWFASESRKITNIRIDDIPFMRMGEKYQLEVSVFGIDGFAYKTNQIVSWSSSNADIATVSENGKLTALSSGVVEITANLGSNLFTTKVINIIDLPILSVSVKKENTLKEGTYGYIKTGSTLGAINKVFIKVDGELKMT